MKYIIAVIILVILFVSNPTLEDHQRAVKDKVSQMLRNEISSSSDKSSSLLGQAGTELGIMYGSSLVDGIIKEVVRRKDYFFFSLTSVEFNGNNQIIGLGILGNVFISDEVDKALKDGAEKLKTGWNEFTKPDNNTSNQYQQNNSSNSIDTTKSSSDYSQGNNSSENQLNDYYVNASENSPVYFYTEPDYNTRRNTYFDSRERVTALQVQNGFAYIEFTNTNNQTSKGWVLLSDMTKIN